MRIGLDVMGGDYAPKAAILGAIKAFNELPSDQHLVLIGDSDQVKAICKEEKFDVNNFELVHTTEIIDMGEHPTKAIMKKPNSSIAVGFSLLKEGKIDTFSSAGNTGAMLVGAVFSVKTINGVIRPSMPTFVPKLNGRTGVILDVGINADCKPEVLEQFGLLGTIFAESILGIQNPKVGLLNIGEEEEKGNMLALSTYPLLKNNPKINFIGNIEGRDLFGDMADVIVCDGFTGNIVLKLAESFYTIAHQKGINNEFIERFDYEKLGGGSILGINSPVVIGHGISNPDAIKSMLFLSRDMHTSGIIKKLKQAFE